MRSLRIHIILPFPVTKPVGGAKIMYEYANRLQARGHQVTVLHSLRRPFKKMRSPLWFKRTVFWLQRAQRPRWFPLHPDCRSLIVEEISNAFVPDGDLIFSTWWQMSYAVAALAPQKGVRINLVQDFENWGGQEQAVRDSYRLPLHHAAISRWLQALVAQESDSPVRLLPNAIDTTRFTISQPLTERIPFSVIALYSEEERKGSVHTLEALVQLHKQFPGLHATLFGVYPRPAHLPSWVHYHRSPVHLPALYNQHAVFMSASLAEGWALPPAEAMACGCAVVCTRIGGHADYANEGQTALLVPVADAPALAQAVATLFTDADYCGSMAQAGHRLINASYAWQHSVDALLDYYLDCQKG